MCEFCTQHGEGKEWYLNMRNYSRELLEQRDRPVFMEHFGAHFEESYVKLLRNLDSFSRIPLAYRFVNRMASYWHRRNHWGQVVPLEDVEQILDLQDSIVRLPCACRSVTTGRQDARYCFGIGVDMSGVLGKYPDAQSLEVLEKEEAKKVIGSFDKQGLVHSVWTFKAPYIGAICNCDNDCLAYRAQVKTNMFQLMFRAEHVAVVDWELCNGCKKCLLNCQFGAIQYSIFNKKPTIDMRLCYGCGVCRAVCDKGAIMLKHRADFAGLPW